jgi:hypothetical protein
MPAARPTMKRITLTHASRSTNAWTIEMDGEWQDPSGEWVRYEDAMAAIQAAARGQNNKDRP